MRESVYRKLPENFFRGKKVILLNDIQNRRMAIPKGTIATITRKRGGFDLKAEACKCCGVSILISRAMPEDVDLYEEVADEKNEVLDNYKN